MKRLLPQGLVVAALVAGAVVPAASATSVPVVNLSNLPLPASAIGAAAESLPLQRSDSGWVKDGRVDGDVMTPNRSLGFFAPVLKPLGWETGYALDYGLGASGGTGITEVRTSVDQYRTSAAAGKGIAVYKKADPMVTRWAGGGLSITAARKRGMHAGSRNLAYLVSYSDSNITPLFGFDEHFIVSRYVGDVTVWAGTAAAAEQLASKLAAKLVTRIKQAQAGKLHAEPVKLPPWPKPGRAPGGPDLSALALQTSDLSGSGTVTQLSHNYHAGGPLSEVALSEFWADFIPAGKYNFLSQAIQWFATANQASLQADFDTSQFGPYAIDLSSVGDGARGVLAGGSAKVVFLSGRLEEEIDFASNSDIQLSDMQGIAQKSADYINAAGLGS